jgi:uncharacterized protein YdhG (YjbR/CyaY superfamily)
VLLLGVKLPSSACLWARAQDGHGVKGLLYLGAVRDDRCQLEHCQDPLDTGKHRVGRRQRGASRDNERMAPTKKSGSESTAEERAAARKRAKELKAQEAAAAALKSVLDKIASLDEPDKTNAERIHAIVTKVAPSLVPKLLYGSPAYANADGKAVLFYQERARFKGRYANLTFFGAAQLDDGTMWPTSWAVTELSSADEKVIAELVRKAIGD